jgi:hypothetical protein
MTIELASILDTSHMLIFLLDAAKFGAPKMRIREIKRRNRPARLSYTLLGLLEEVKPRVK